MRVWRDGGWRGRLAGWLLRVGTLTRFMFPETGEEVEFQIEHAVNSHDDGSLSMSWIRTFQFDQVKRRFDALMRFHPDQGPIVIWTGCLGCLEVELCPRVEGNAIVVVSRREWLKAGFLRIPIPGWLKGRPHVREWQEPDGALRIQVKIHNTLLGRFFGYEGSIQPSATNDVMKWLAESRALRPCRQSSRNRSPRSPDETGGAERG